MSRGSGGMAKAVEILDVVRGVGGGKVVHAFVETSMICNLDPLG